jgi:histone-lysine N-methyltransferase SETMAR
MEYGHFALNRCCLSVANTKSCFSLCQKMENFQPNQWRICIFMRSQLGESAIKIHADLAQVIGGQAPFYRTVARWIESVNAGRTSLNDDPRSGRPSTAVTETNIAAVRALVDEDPNIMVAMISKTIGISDGSVHTILHDHLGLRKVTARWVPHLLTDEQKRERVRCSQKFLRNFAHGGSQRLSDVVTGDEKWFHYFQVP